MQFRKIKVTIKGIRSYMQHRRPLQKEEADKITATIKILQKNPWDMNASQQEAELGAYKNLDGKYYIPAEHLQESLTSAGARIQVKGQGKRTYKDYMKSYVIVDPDEIVLTPQQFTLDRRYVKVMRAGIMRNRPRFDSWQATFTLIITDPSLPVETIKEILEIAGARVGIGDYRPKYGLFEVTEFEETEQ